MSPKKKAVEMLSAVMEKNRVRQHTIHQTFRNWPKRLPSCILLTVKDFLGSYSSTPIGQLLLATTVSIIPVKTCQPPV